MAKSKRAIPTSGAWHPTLPSEMELGPFCNQCEYLEHAGPCDKVARPCKGCGHEAAARNREELLTTCSCTCHDGPRFIFGVELQAS